MNRLRERQYCSHCRYDTRPTIRDRPQYSGTMKGNVDYDAIVCTQCQEEYQ